jgi:uncharacterized DUF497 family protein
MVRFKYKSPAIYKIKVDGEISKNWSDKLGGMQINVVRSKHSEPISILVGRINDQAALSGVLNTLYENHVSIISVKKLDDEVLDF